MSGRLPPFSALRAFEATARLGSVTRAADELHVTHGAVSQQIRVLEDFLGEKLFDRSARSMKLTPGGATMRFSLSKAFAAIAEATSSAAHPANSGILRISSVQHWLSHWLMPRLHQFMEIYPGIRLSVSPSTDARRIHSSQFDVCILYGNGNWNDCWCRLWSRTELFPVVSPRLLSRRPIRTVRDLNDYSLLHSDDGSDWNTWLAAAGEETTTDRRWNRFNNARLATEGAVHGQGVSLGDSVTSSLLVERGDLVTPFELRIPANKAFYVACRTEVRHTPLASAFIDWLFAAMGNVSP